MMEGTGGKGANRRMMDDGASVKATYAVADDYDKFMQEIATLK